MYQFQVAARLGSDTLWLWVTAQAIHPNARQRLRNYRVVEDAIAHGEPLAEEERQTEPEPTPQDRRAMAKTLGRAGGKVGGKVRTERLTAERNCEESRGDAVGQRLHHSQFRSVPTATRFLWGCVAFNTRESQPEDHIGNFFGKKLEFIRDVF